MLELKPCISKCVFSCMCVCAQHCWTMQLLAMCVCVCCVFEEDSGIE